MPPTLEITPEITSLTVSYLTAMMLWVDDAGARAEAMQTFTAMHLSNTLGPAAQQAVGAHLNLFEMALHAVRPGELRERAEQRYRDGIYIGSLIAGAVMCADAGMKKIDFEGAKRRAAQLTASFPGSRSHASLDKTVLPRFRPVGHLWAAYVWGVWQGADRAEFPCRLDRVTEFLAIAEFFRERAIGIRFPRRGGRVGGTALLDANQAWRLPPGLPITRLEVLFGKI